MNKIPQKWKTLRVKRCDTGEIFKCYKDKYDQNTMESEKTGERYCFILSTIREDNIYKLLEVQRGEKQTFYLYDQQQIEKANEYGRKLKTKYDNIHYISGRGDLTIEGYNAVERVA